MVIVSPNPAAKLADRAMVAISTRWYAASIVLVAWAALLLVTNVNIVSPIMGWDEYANFSQSREFPDLAHLLTYDPFPLNYNIVYFWIGHLLWSNASDPALTMRALQAFLYVLLFPVFYCLCRQFLSRWNSVACAFLGLITARSSFSAYFMPETVYVFLFFLSIMAAVYFFRRPLVSASSSGVLVAVLTLTKPHGIAVAIGIALAWSLCALFPRLVGIGRARSLLALIVFGAAFYFGLISVNALLTSNVEFNPLQFVGDAYGNFWTSRAHPMAPLRDLLTVIAGNAVPLALFIGFPFIYTLLWLVQRVPAQEGAAHDYRERVWFFAILAVCVSAIVLGMVTNFTAQVGGEEIWRMHGRYYSFLVPCYLLLMLAAAENRQTRQHTPSLWLLRAAAVMGLALMAIIQFSWRAGYTIAPWDFPEIFAFTTWTWIPGSVELGTTLVLIGVAGFAAILLWPPRGAYIFACFFLIINLASLGQTTRWQFSHARAFSPYTQTAAALRLLIPPESLDHGVIIGTDRGNVSYILVPLRSRSRVLLLPANSVVDAATVGGAQWVILDGTFDLRLDTARVVMHKGPLTFLLLRDLPPFVREIGVPRDRSTTGSNG